MYVLRLPEKLKDLVQVSQCQVRVLGQRHLKHFQKLQQGPGLIRHLKCQAVRGVPEALSLELLQEAYLTILRGAPHQDISEVAEVLCIQSLNLGKLREDIP